MQIGVGFWFRMWTCFLILTLSFVLSEAQRVDAGLTHLYDFQYEPGGLVSDVSGISPLEDLQIIDTNSVFWLPDGGIELQSSSLIRSNLIPSKAYSQITSGDEITLEVWIEAANLSQGGPARILTLSRNNTKRNFSLSQEGSDYWAQLRNSSSNSDGDPELAANSSVSTSLQHVVFVHASDGNEQIYVDGVLINSGFRPGDFSSWNSTYDLAIGNELNGARSWLGKIYLVAIYDRALSFSELDQNYQHGPYLNPQDTIAPVLSQYPVDLSIPCDSSVSAPVITALDNLDGVVSVSFSESSSGSCPEILSRTWQASDAAGNQVSHTQQITLLDTLAPELSTMPLDTTIECGDALPGVPAVSALDACDGLLSTSLSQVFGPDFVRRTWSVSDACGNSSAHVQQIDILDTQAPVFSTTLAPDTIIYCGDVVPPSSDLQALDACDGLLTSSAVESTVDLGCTSTISRSWIITDAAGNSISHTQDITVVDTVAPAFDFFPADISVSCVDSVPVATIPFYSDACSDSIDLIFSEIVFADSIYRSWQITDVCGNASSRTQKIFIIPSAPTLQNTPADIILSCTDTIPAVANVWAQGSCGDSLAVVFEENAGAGCSYQISRSWYAIFNADTIRHTQLIDVVDTLAPEGTLSPSLVSWYCADPISPPAVFTVSDQCDPTVVVNYFEQEYTDSIQRFWFATDDCGNTSTFEQLVLIIDTIAPQFDDAVSDVSINCGDPLPGVPTRNGSDACASSLVMDFEEVIDSNSCPLLIQRIWSLQDDFGNVVRDTQRISINDIAAPVLFGVPSDTVLQQFETPASVSVTAIDDCLGAVSVNYTEFSSTAGDSLWRVWSATDNCSNMASDTQLIVFQDSPNIIFILIDDLNDYVWADGNQNPPSPNIQELGNSGTVFNSCYTNSPLCNPSRVSMLVGLSPQTTEVYRNINVLEFRDQFPVGDTVITIPQFMRENGYYSVGINKIFHNFFRPTFDNDYDVAEPNPLARGGSWNEFYLLPDEDYATTSVDVLTGTGYTWIKVDDADEPLMTDYKAITKSIETLEDYQANPTNYGDQPLFMMLGLVKPHVPHEAPERYFPAQFIDNINFPAINYLSPENPGGWALPDYGPGGAAAIVDSLHPSALMMAEIASDHQDAFDKYGLDVDSLTSLTAEQLTFMRMANANMAYYASVQFIDAQVGRLMDALDSLGMTDNTIIVLTSDHGFSQGERRHWAKNSLWDDDLRVPLLIRDPRRGNTADVNAEVSLMDLFPTLVDLADLPEPSLDGTSSYLEGRSLKPLMDAQSLPDRPSWSWIALSGNDTVNCDIAVSVRNSNQHLFELPYDTTPCSLFDLEYIQYLYDLNTDPKEWNEISDDPLYASSLSFLNSLLPGDSGWVPYDIPDFRIISSGPDTVFATDFVTLNASVFEGDLELSLSADRRITWEADVGGLREVSANSVFVNFNQIKNFLDTDSSFTVRAYLRDADSWDILAMDQVRFKVQSAAARESEEAEPGPDNNSSFSWFDLMGRPVRQFENHRVYINTDGEKVIWLQDVR